MSGPRSDSNVAARNPCRACASTPQTLRTVARSHPHTERAGASSTAMAAVVGLERHRAAGEHLVGAPLRGADDVPADSSFIWWNVAMSLYAVSERQIGDARVFFPVADESRPTLLARTTSAPRWGRRSFAVVDDGVGRA